MSSLKTEGNTLPLTSEATESVFRSVTEAEVSLDEMLSLACRQGKQDIVELLLESGANVNHRNKAGNTPLLEACSQGHVSIAKLLLDRSAEIDAPTETTFDSALTWACTLGNLDIVIILLDSKANVEHRTKDGCTALMFAALAGHEKVAKLLLDHKAKINVESDSNKDSPLTFACWKGHQKVVKLFLERKADIEHRTKEGFSPLMFAALGGHTQVAELLLRHRAEVNTPSGSNNDIPLTSACWKGHHQVVHLLLQHNSDIEHRTKDGCTPLMLAAREGHLSVAKLLLRHVAKVNVPSGSENNIPLTLACWKGHRDVVDLLLANSSNIEHQNKAGCTPLMLAAREGHLEATLLLLDSGAQIDVPSGSNDDTPLTLACWKGHDVVVQLLIERHSSVNHQTKTGCTPLMEATREGHVGVARLLLEAGADVETPDNYGQSPFFMACWKGHADVAALLLEYDANKDCRTKTGITPLFQACRENHVDVVKLLLEFGCNPSTPFPNSRECPLTLAAEKGYADLAYLLMERSANVETRTKKGCTPFFLACKEGFPDIAVMLAEHGATIEAPDQRGTTPLLAAYKNGCVDVVDWLLGQVAHLPSDQDCQKALMSPMPADTDLLPQRSKCLDLIMKAKKAREQAALKNAQSLFEELDAEKEKKSKAAARKRDKKQKQKRRKEQLEKNKQICGDYEEDSGEYQRPVDGRQSSPDFPHPLPDPPPTQPDPPVADSAPPSNDKSKKKKKKKSKPAPAPKLDQVILVPPTQAGYISDCSAESQEFHDAQSELPGIQPLEAPSSTVKDSPPKQPPPVVAKQPSKPFKQPPKVESEASKTAQKTTENKRPQHMKAKPKAPPSITVATQGVASSQSTAKKPHSVTKNRTPVAPPPREDGVRSNKRGQKQVFSTPPATTAREPSPATRYEDHVRSGEPEKEEIVQEENLWTEGGDWEGLDLVMLSRHCTDDDKIRSQKLQAAAAQYTPTTRPSSTAALPTSSAHTSTPSTTAPSQSTLLTTTASQRWHEVTRTTRTDQLTVSNNLVGRIIGRGGSKINNIQEMSGAHINVSKNIPQSTDRLITIRGTQRSITRAKELIDEALSTTEGGALLSSTPSPVPFIEPPNTRSTSPAQSVTRRRYADVVPVVTTPAESSCNVSTACSSTINTLSHSETKTSWSVETSGSFAAVAGCVSSTQLYVHPSEQFPRPLSALSGKGETRTEELARPLSSLSGKNETREGTLLARPSSSLGVKGETNDSARPLSSLSVKSETRDSDQLTRPLSSLSGKSETKEGDFKKDLESTTDFPPLKHGRSLSDPQVSSKESEVLDEDTVHLSLQMKYPQSNKLPPVSPSDESAQYSPSEGADADPGGEGPTAARPSKSELQRAGPSRQEARQQRMSLPAKTIGLKEEPRGSDIPAEQPGRGHYGAIGPPPRPRKTSTPASFGGNHSPSRKLSYAGMAPHSQFRGFSTLENLGENDPLSSPTIAPPPTEGVWLNDSGGPRERSFSWAGYNFHGPHFQPQPRGHAPFAHKPRPDHPHQFSPTLRPREPHPPGVYGPIGSSLAHVPKSHSLPNAHQYQQMYPPNELWVTQNRTLTSSFAPRMFHPPRQMYAFANAQFNNKQKPMGRAHRGEEHHPHEGKRWSVPGYTSLPRPAVPINPIWGQPPGTLNDQSDQFPSDSLAYSDPWGSSWPNLANPPDATPPPGAHFLSEPWAGEEGRSELGQLLKRLDISEEHTRALKARKLSLQQLHSMSDEEWRGLKLPVGPRVKLMNAVSNINMEDGRADSKSSDLSDSGSPKYGQGSPPDHTPDHTP